MKRCPACKRVETDDALVFCRADGTALVSDSLEAEATRVLPESRATGDAPTAVLRNTGEGQLTTSPLKPGPPSANIGAPRKSISRRKVALIICLFVVIAVVVAGYVFYRHARDSEVAIDSIAVLPFENQTHDPDSEYLSDGVTESIINSLTQLPNLKVIARSSVFRYKGKDTDPIAVGNQLGVRAVLTGRIMQRGDNLTISAELIDVRDNKQLWGEKYSAKASDLLSVQRQIASQITSNLRLKLSGADESRVAKRYTENEEAYKFYLQGRYYWNKRTADGIRKAIEQFQHAIDRDPNYALAHVGLADCYLVMENYAGTPTSEVLPKAKAATLRALQIDDSLAEAHVSLAMIHIHSWQWGDSEAEFKRAIQLNPNYPTAHHWYSNLLTYMARFDEAMAEIKRAQELDPLSTVIAVNVARSYILRGDLDGAIAVCNNSLEIDPTFPQSHVFLALAYQRQERYSEAIEEAQKGVDLSKRGGVELGTLGYCDAVAGKRSEALAIIRELEEKYARRESMGVYLAWIYAGIGDKDQSFAWLEKDFKNRTGTLAGQITELTILDTLRSDPRYGNLLHRMGLRP
jgi:TolB-like protein/Flp pilus assembly protein TadD